MCVEELGSGMAALQVVYSEFLDLVNTGNVRQARIDESLQKVYFSVRPLQPAEQQDAAAEASTSGAFCAFTAPLITQQPGIIDNP